MTLDLEEQRKNENERWEGSLDWGLLVIQKGWKGGHFQKVEKPKAKKKNEKKNEENSSIGNA